MKCEFKNVDLSDVYFVGSCFEKCSFLNCMMSKADFSETTLVGGKIKECIAVKVNFYKSRLEAINIEKNDLRVINFTKAIMSNCYIIKSNISNGIFKETYIINTEFKEIEGIDECRVTNIYTDAERKIKIEGKDIIEWLGDNISQSKQFLLVFIFQQRVKFNVPSRPIKFDMLLDFEATSYKKLEAYSIGANVSMGIAL